MLGVHEGSKSFTGGFYSFVNDIERLNSLINWHNLGNFAHRKYMKDKKMQYWKPEHQDYEKAVGFLNGIIIKCDEFLS
jgi:hypothetical protein